MEFVMTTETLKDLKDFVQNSIDKGASSVEDVHKTIAGLPLDFIAKFGLLHDQAEKVKGLQESTIGSIYDTIRMVNEKSGEYAEEILLKTTEKTEN
tara:strand:+ start:3027 stop:3314 length:288 start_codon:yes stop_codon:yes gene_type:complete